MSPMRFSYGADLRRARQRVASGSRIAQTAAGPIEYTEIGQGPAVLLVHGAGGGFDQCLQLARELAGAGFRVVAMSRFGYLRTPLPPDASPAAQADAHAALLDALGIAGASIIGISAGAPSSMQFALRHPQRCSAMVLHVPLAWAPREPVTPSPVARFVYGRVLKSDLLFWLLLKTARPLLVKTILGTPPEVVEHASAEEQRRAHALLEQILPVSERQQGLLNDGAIGTSIERFELEKIAVRTLLISLPDDLYGTFESARYSAAHMPNARFVSYANGGHAWVGHHREVLSETIAFLRPQ
jgi:2-hydroxy-6-oxonona-2,4-dienedioate hydrolase